MKVEFRLLDVIMVFVIASNNQNKIKEIAAIYDNLNFKSLKELNIVDEAIEDKDTFKGNAIKKALYIALKYQVICIADDSGLCCLGLNKEPGVRSARYAKDHDDQANNQKLIANIKNVKNKKAYYEAVIAIALPNGKTYTKSGKVWGKIILEGRGNNGFGYDPYFYIPKLKKTMAELTMAEKNAISHRAKALRALKPILRKLARKWN